MAKIKLTKGELKRHRDALRQYQRYLPTLQLKKQQLQIEILHQLHIFNERQGRQDEMRTAVLSWAGLLAVDEIDIAEWIALLSVKTSVRNIAGLDIPIFERAEFNGAEYDLFAAPLWVDRAIEALRELVSLREELAVIEKGIQLLRVELRITTQRVNLFEKVKIPEAEEAIRRIKIYIGDQLANAVGRSKIAKRKIEQTTEETVTSLASWE